MSAYLSQGNRYNMNGIKVTYFNLGNATSVIDFYLYKNNGRWYINENKPSFYANFTISDNSLVCNALYPQESDWTIEYWSGRN